MTDIERGSLEYFMTRAADGPWRGFLQVLATELRAQMPAPEIRAFFHVLGNRLATRDPLPVGQSLGDLEVNVNRYFSQAGWGWMRLRDLNSSLELLHSCAPLRQAFGDEAMEWAPALLEGLYAGWFKQLGAGHGLQLQQVGGAEGAADTLRFRLAHPNQAT